MRAKAQQAPQSELDAVRMSREDFTAYTNKTWSQDAAVHRVQSRKADLAGTMSHEVGHLVSPTPTADLPMFGLLEEATTEVATSVPGAIEETAQKLGLAIDPADIKRYSYAGPAKVVRDYLTRAGIDHSNPAHSSEVIRLTQSVPAAEVPNLIATTIGTRESLSNGAISSLAKDIADAIVAAPDPMFAAMLGK
jgi:hypothetical protein